MDIQTFKDIATEIFTALGTGQTEPVYQEAYEVELRLRNILYSRCQVEILYKGFSVGSGKVDLLIMAYPLIIELKAEQNKFKLKGRGDDKQLVTDFPTNNRVQLRDYMKWRNVPDGLLINFPQPSGCDEEPKEVEFNEVTFR